eukprot:CAMPEP_0181088234 /NCGR_PEP_ID=MMETSP1071-20121207/6678_1 /TAXON_ID=35127 /ORGANISM="Thalassiosira sp., Strain NH16" /LENGTH=492 /DNA_ID=CAMNT_0023170137 /DNA_START=58 /DNA_END=1536 /DNA_ORIENTATION=+
MSSGQEVGEIFGDGTGRATALLRSPTVIIAAVGLWGMNVYLFRLFGIDYAHVLTLDLVKEKEANGKGGDKDDSSGDLCSTGNVVGGINLEKRHGHGPGGSNSSTTSSNSGSASKTHYHHNHGPTNSTIDGEVTAGKLVVFSLFLLLLLHISTVIWIDFFGGSTIGAIFAFYTSVIVGLLIPLPSSAWIRTACVTVFHRAFELINPRCFCLQSGIPRAVPFIDVFFADAMCSLSKVFFDWGMLWHLAWHFPQPVPMELHSIAIPSIAASLPYLIRARQCLVMHTIGRMKGDPKRYQHMLNAIKYSTSLWPLIVSAYQKVVPTEEEKATLENILIILFAINSTYSLAWDIIMDWGMMQNPQNMMPESCAGSAPIGPGGSKTPQSCAHSVLRPRLRFGASTSITILLIDMVLRYSWMLRFWEKDLFPNMDIYILCTQFMEAIRRALWNLLRVEWENIKQNRGKESQEDVEMQEKDPFLPVSAMSMSPRATPQHQQ